MAPNLIFITYTNQQNIIKDVVLRKLVVSKDPRGSLVEVLKETWDDVFQYPKMGFGQSYVSVTNPGFARDEDTWHNHPTKQIDRFAIIKGSAVVALYDWRESSATQGTLNLFLIGEMNGGNDQYLLLIPRNVLHAFCTVGNTPCYLVSFPNCPYDPSEEGRIPFAEVKARFPDGSAFSWNPIRRHFKNR